MSRLQGFLLVSLGPDGIPLIISTHSSASLSHEIVSGRSSSDDLCNSVHRKLWSQWWYSILLFPFGDLVLAMAAVNTEEDITSKDRDRRIQS